MRLPAGSELLIIFLGIVIVILAVGRLGRLGGEPAPRSGISVKAVGSGDEGQGLGYGHR